MRSPRPIASSIVCPIFPYRGFARSRVPERGIAVEQVTPVLCVRDDGTSGCAVRWVDDSVCGLAWCAPRRGTRSRSDLVRLAAWSPSVLPAGEGDRMMGRRRRPSTSPLNVLVTAHGADLPAQRNYSGRHRGGGRVSSWRDRRRGYVGHQPGRRPAGDGGCVARPWSPRWSECGARPRHR
jgi:hypothetical protein